MKVLSNILPSQLMDEKQYVLLSFTIKLDIAWVTKSLLLFRLLLKIKYLGQGDGSVGKDTCC